MMKTRRQKIELKDCFIIHLERATERKSQVRKLTEKIPYRTKIITAVDGRYLSDDLSKIYTPKLLRPRYPFPLRKAEIAAFLSHRKCWQRIVDEGLDAALIVEDDVEIIDSEFKPAVNLAMQQIEKGDLIRFPIKLREKPKDLLAKNGNVSIFRPYVVGLGMIGQIVTFDAARRLIEKTENLDRPVDTYTQLSWDHGVRVLTLWPNGIREISSDLGGSLIGTTKKKRERLRREILRPIYRAKLDFYSRLNGQV